jgi:hypothetical protein
LNDFEQKFELMFGFFPPFSVEFKFDLELKCELETKFKLDFLSSFTMVYGILELSLLFPSSYK